MGKLFGKHQTCKNVVNLNFMLAWLNNNSLARFLEILPTAKIAFLICIQLQKNKLIHYVTYICYEHSQ